MDSKTLTNYERDVLESADANLISLNAFECIKPTEEFCAQIGRRILDMLSEEGNLIYPHQGSEVEALQRIGQLTPELIVRVSKS